MKIKISKYIYLAALRLNREPVSAVLQELEKTQWYPGEALKEIQWKRIKSIISYAYGNVPFYARSFKSQGISPGDINSLTDMRKIPYVTKNDLIVHKNLLKSAQPPEGYKISLTSGTTGEVSLLLKSKTSWAYHHAKLLRAYRWYGVDIGDRWAKIMGGKVPLRQQPLDLAKNLAFNRIKISTVNMTKEICEKFYHRMINFSPSFIYGYPTAISHLIEELKEKGFDGKGIKVKFVVCSGETLSDRIRNEIEGFFACKVVNDYACSEVGTISIECPEGNMHIPIESVFVETVNTQQSGEEDDEIVITDLHNYVMPLIRYKTGDFASLKSGQCNCGRGLPLMEMPRGRASSIIATSDGKMVHSNVFTYIFTDEVKYKYGNIKQYQVIHKNPDHFVVNLVGRLDINCRNFLISELKNHFGENSQFEINFVNNIERSPSGKLTYYVKDF